MKTFKSQLGVAVLEVIILVGVLAIGAAVYYVNAHSNIKNPPPISVPKKTTKTTPPVDPPTSASVITIKEIGVKITVTNDIKDLDYAVKTSSGYTYVYLSTKTLEDADSGPVKHCTSEEGAIGAIELDDKPSTAEGSPPSLVKMLAGKYLYYTHPQALCSDVASTQKLQNDFITSFRKALDSAELVN